MLTNDDDNQSTQLLTINLVYGMNGVAWLVKIGIHYMLLKHSRNQTCIAR